jgi:pyruvate-ferredoxin/flavodoxin oxidoreductase
VVRAVFYGLGSDGTVGANKNSIKIIGNDTANYAQGYFVYDSKKSGAVTVSHLRFGPDKIRSTYLIDQANFVGCHQWTFLEKLNVLDGAANGATFLLNSPYGPDEVWGRLPIEIQEPIIRKGLKFYVIDANKVARDSGMGNRINTVMQVCFFALAGVLPREEAIAQIKKSIEKTYGKKGAEIVRMNLQAVDNTLDNLFEVNVGEVNSDVRMVSPVPAIAPDFVREVEGAMLSRQGDKLAVSQLPCDGTYPTGTSKWEKRNVAQEIPVWDPDVCVQCGKCIMVCPHAVIRGKAYDEGALNGAPDTFKSTAVKDKAFKPAKNSPSRCPRKTAPAAACASMSARPRTSPCPPRRRSTWNTSRRCGPRSGKTGSIS